MKRFFTLLFTALTIVACTETDKEMDTPPTNDTEQPDDGTNEGENEGTNEGTNEGDNESHVITITIEGNDDTRVHLNEARKTVWDENDLLSVFYRTATYQQWQFQGSTGDREGTITPVGEVENTETNGNIVVLYPDNSSYTYDMENNTIAATVSATQHYAEGSYGAEGNILVAQSATNSVSLKNVYGWLRVELTGKSTSIASIKLTGNDNEQLAGAVTINPAEATATFASTGDTEVTLTCDGGVALSDTNTSFYLGLVPQTFQKGITIEITDTNGGKMVKSTSKPVAILRNAIQPMSAFEYIPDATDEEIEKKFPANTSIWYGNSQLTFSSSPTNANIVKHEFGACANGECFAFYGMDFDAEVTTINAAAFHGKKVDIIYLPHSVKTIGQSAFLGIQELEEVHIGRGVEKFETGAFSNCGNLQRLYIRAVTPPSLGDYALLRNSTGDYVYIGALIYVPEEAVETYKAHAQWGKYANYIVGYNFVAGEAAGGGNTGGGDASSQFNHRLLILDHTDEGCGYCPEAMDRLYALANSEYTDCYHEVTLHAGSMSSSDPAYSAAARAVYYFQGAGGLPTIYLNYKGGKIPRGNSDEEFLTTMSNTFNVYRSKTGAAVGIAMETSVSGSTLNVEVEVTSAEEQRYYLAVWVLENNIDGSGQSNATKPHHKVYNHALRYIATEYDDTYMSGNSLGKMAVGATNTKSFTIPIASNWVAGNLEVLAIVSANDEVVNCALCPAGQSKDYEYLDTDNGCGNDDIIDGGNDDPNAIQLTTMTYEGYADSYGSYSFKFTDGNTSSVSLHINEGAASSDGISNCQLVTSEYRSQAGNINKFFADSVKIDGVSKKVSSGTMLVLQGKMSLSLTFTDDTTQAFTYTF